MLNEKACHNPSCDNPAAQGPGHRLPIVWFYKSKARADSYDYYCKHCRVTKNLEMMARNPERCATWNFGGRGRRDPGIFKREEKRKVYAWQKRDAKELLKLKKDGRNRPRTLEEKNRMSLAAIGNKNAKGHIGAKSHAPKNLNTRILLKLSLLKYWRDKREQEGLPEHAKRVQRTKVVATLGPRTYDAKRAKWVENKSKRTYSREPVTYNRKK